MGVDTQPDHGSGRPRAARRGCMAATPAEVAAKDARSTCGQAPVEAAVRARVLRRRALGVGAAAGIVVFSGLLALRADAPTLWSGLTGRALPLVAVAAIAGLATMVLLLRRRYGAARLSVVAAVVAVVSGWGVGQYPWLLVDEVRINDAGGAPATLAGLLVVVGLAGVLVLPPLLYLFRLTQSEPWSRVGH